jgi:hypothetical protein
MTPIVPLVVIPNLAGVEPVAEYVAEEPASPLVALAVAVAPWPALLVAFAVTEPACWLVPIAAPKTRAMMVALAVAKAAAQVHHQLLRLRRLLRLLRLLRLRHPLQILITLQTIAL